MAARLTEVYSLQCHACGREIELKPADVRDGAGRCPECGAALSIEWRPKE
jgi:rRNA maturation endonuclease Nob1